MKITRNMPQQLIVGNNPIFISAMLVVMILVFVGVSIALVVSGEPMGFLFLIGVVAPGICLVVFGRRVQLIFDADDGTLTVQRKSLIGQSKVVHALHEVDKAILEKSSGKNGNLYRITLVLTGQSAGHKPITRSYSNIGDHKGVMQAINTWLDSYRARA